MNKLKLINELTEDEFEDFMYARTDINSIASGLNYEISSICNLYFNKNIPHIIVFDNSELSYLNYKTYYDYSIIKISPQPYTLYDGLDLSEDDLNDIFEFIKINKKILMQYWNWKYGSIELKNKIQPIPDDMLIYASYIPVQIIDGRQQIRILEKGNK